MFVFYLCVMGGCFDCLLFVVCCIYEVLCDDGVLGEVEVIGVVNLLGMLVVCIMCFLFVG